MMVFKNVRVVEIAKPSVSQALNDKTLTRLFVGKLKETFRRDKVIKVQHRIFSQNIFKVAYKLN